MELFSAKEVSKSFANHQALNKVSISVEEGSIFGLLGPNGAGKTTLIRIINQITGPDSGSVWLNGKPLKAEDIDQIGYLPEERGLYKKMKVGEQALYLGQLKGLSRRDAMKELKIWFEKFEITAWWDKKVMELSKGMQQKVQFICTVLHKPRLLIFDEPFSGFDPINTDIITREILQMKKNGATIIFSTHNMESVEQLCDHIALIDKSKKILDGATQQIREKYKSNIYDIAYRGELDIHGHVLAGKYNILANEQNGNGNKLSIQYPDGSNSRELIRDLVEHVEIVSFNEVIPSMNEVFIKVVKQNA
ncbi:MAG TPA: ATP-binding cassette domain-containing protein [Prolixibacteraceae bacterium]|nr:ATP-binding cassette domain-containing protein [Prolixibacteraceae bacterium]